ncbi:MAG: hypothetical protein J7480_07975, partial [Microbacteriaceae bacterium]|nr:hypothetical protein [Microbacteriaceae bacterium]
MSGTLWIDLTDLERWGGVHGGTQRVTYGIAEALRRQQENVRFLSYSNRWDRFVETSIEPIVERVEHPPVPVPVVPTHSFAYRVLHRLRVLVPRGVRGNPAVRERAARAAARIRPA